MQDTSHGKQSRRNFIGALAVGGLVVQGSALAGAPQESFSARKGSMEKKGLLMPVTMYGPDWVKKEFEPPFCVETANRALEHAAAGGINLVMMEIGDGVIYSRRPQLTRHYSAPLADLAGVSEHARGLGIDFVPGLNFAKSGRCMHDEWMAPFWRKYNWLWRVDEYFRVAEDCIAELVEVCKPGNYFYIGMDEDHYRSADQFVETVERIREIVVSHKLRPIMANDTCYLGRKYSIAQVYADKVQAAEPRLSKDIIQGLWDYDKAEPGCIKRLTDQGFTVLVAPGDNPDRIRRWKENVLNEGGSGMFITAFFKVSRDNRARLLDLIDAQVPFYA